MPSTFSLLMGMLEGSWSWLSARLADISANLADQRTRAGRHARDYGLRTAMSSYVLTRSTPASGDPTPALIAARAALALETALLRL
jgi:hypothetical protein